MDAKTAFRDTIPVLTGYIVLGMGFGILMHANGYGFLWSVAMSLFIYAGSCSSFSDKKVSGDKSPETFFVKPQKSVASLGSITASEL